MLDFANPRILVVLSGGFDSSGTLLLALASDLARDVRAVSFAYGQEHSAELHAAGLLCERRRVPHVVIHLGEAVRGDVTLRAAEPGTDKNGISLANLPIRNGIFLLAAAAHGARLWPGEGFDLAVGCHADDAAAFPDCREEFLASMALSLALGLHNVAAPRVVAPWVRSPKAAILAWCKDSPGALDDLRASVSCYRGTRCGRCDACSLRAKVFADAGLADGTDVLRPFGGDPGRGR